MEAWRLNRRRAVIIYWLMRCCDYAFVVGGWLVAASVIAPAVAQPSSTPAATAAQRQVPAPPNFPTLAFDAESKRYDASAGEIVAPFSFNLTNVWTNEIIIDRVQGSCSCTAANLPENPWHLPPKASGEVKATVRLAGKMGLISKTLTLYYRLMPDNISLTHVLNVNVNVPLPPSAAANLSEDERKAAMEKAKADAQAIFKGDCARCHADKGRNAFGQDLYAADCGICHEASHRDSLVPDLHALKQPTDFDFWKTIITLGKPHSMMPAFAATQGGPLTDAQITSLATYLNHTISGNFTSAAK
jgi:mono/diheme cytochrome c family protein